MTWTRKPLRFLSFAGGHTRKWGQGYIVEEAPNHPACNIDGFVLQHRLVMESHLGRYLSSKEIVHHIDEDKTNNAIDNLMLFPNPAAHRAEHNRMKGANLDESKVLEALQEHTTQEAAEILGIHHQTLRNHFDSLLKKRQSPHDPDDPQVIDLVRNAASARKGIRSFAKETGISAPLVKKICERNDILWIPKSRKGCKGRNMK
jgi:hypothetical protein